MQIRAATSQDEPAIRACAGAAFAPYVPLIGRRPAPMDTDFGPLIAAGQVRVAEAAGQVAAFAAFFPQDGWMQLDTVAVFPALAGQGIGRALIAACEAEARAAGLRGVRLYTNAKMAANLRLYPCLGYAETGRRLEDGFDRVFFERPV